MKALIVFSGGQDSTTALGKAMYDGFECEAIGFDYGQKHKVELEQAQKIADKLKVPYRIVQMHEFGKLVAGETALVGNGGGLDVNDRTPLAHMNQSVHASFVPNRNAMMLTIAHAYAQIIGACSIWTGVCETDYSGYPDCRANFIRALQFALNTGYETTIDIITPLMHLNKAQTFTLAEECGVLDLVIEESHTCYNGKRDTHWAWGDGCGACPACELRAKGWAEYKALIDINHSGNE
jgi:7-cyano-7-deazaguanine synthase